MNETSRAPFCWLSFHHSQIWRVNGGKWSSGKIDAAAAKLAVRRRQIDACAYWTQLYSAQDEFSVALRPQKPQGILMVVVDRFYIALFSAVEQTHCTLVTCNSKFI